MVDITNNTQQPASVDPTKDPSSAFYGFNPQQPEQVPAPSTPEQPSTSSATTEELKQKVINDAIPIGNLQVDLAKGAVNGIMEFGHSISDLMADAGNAVIHTVSDTDFQLKAPEPSKFVTKTAGKVTEGVTQFAVGFAAGGAALKMAGVAAESGLAYSMGRGAIADTISFREDEERLSNLIQQYPSLQNPITEFLQSKPDDHWALGRLKNAAEGVLLGAATELVIPAIKGLKKAQDLFAAGKPAEAKEALESARVETNSLLSRGAKADIPPTDVIKATEEAVPTAPRFTPEESKELLKRISSGEGGLADVSDAFNVTKWKDAEDGKQVINEFVKDLKAKEPEAFTDVQTFERVKQLASDLSVSPDELTIAIKSRLKDADNMAAEVFALSTRTITVADSVPKLIRTLKTAQEAGDTAGVEAAQKGIDNLMQFLADDIVDLKTLQKGHARATGIGRASKEVINDPARAITPDQLVTLHKDFAGDKEGFYKKVLDTTQDPSTMRKVLTQVVRTRTWDIVNEVWINSILSSPTTQVINAGTNTIETLVKPLEGATAALFRGNTNAAKAEMKFYTGLVSNFKDSYEMAKKALVTDKNILDLGQGTLDVDKKAVKAYISKDMKFKTGETEAGALVDIGQLIRLPSRFLSTSDEFFKQINYRARLYSDGYLQGMDLGLTGKELKDYAQQNVLKGFDKETGAALDADALRYAQDASFTNELEYGVGQSIQNMTAKHPALRQILPFIRTPVNLYRNTITRTPLAFLDDGARDALMGRNGVKAQSLAKARVATGSALMGMASLLAANGLIEGSAPKDPDLRRQFFASGRKEYAFKLPNGTYFSFNRLDPRFAVFGIVADIGQHMGELSDEDNALVNFVGISALSFTKNMASKTYLQGLSQLMDVVMAGDQDKWEDYLSRQVGSRVIPFSSLLRTLNPDQEVKDLRDFTDGILANVPSFSGLVEAKRDALGNKMMNSGKFIGTLNPSIVQQELYDLHDRFTIPQKKFSGTNIDMTNYKSKTGQTAYDRYQELAGQIKVGGKTLEQTLEQYIKSPSYQALPKLDPNSDYSSERSKILSTIISRYRRVAMVQMRQEYPELDKDIRTAQRNAAVVPIRGESAAQKLLNDN